MRITGPVDPYFAAFVVPQSAGSAPPPLVVAPVTEPTQTSGATVTLLTTGANKIQVIKTIREATGLGLKESLDLAESAPKLVKTGLSSEAADRLATALRGAGATVEVAGGGPSAPEAAAPIDSGSTARVALGLVGPNKIAVIKAVREATRLGLRESLQIVEAAPQTIENLTPAAAQRLLQLLHEAGAAAQLA